LELLDCGRQNLRLVRQAKLEYKQGTSDKIYEVDLCEVGSDQFVVNFRYGRRGATLRDGSKTPAAVSEAAAESIFEDLVASKEAKGYRRPGSTAAPSEPDVSPAVVETTGATLDGRRLAVPALPAGVQ